MKKTVLLLMTTILCATGHAQSALFRKYENTGGVSTVVVSKTMLRTISKVNVGNRKIRKLASKIDNLRVLSCKRQHLISKISKDAMKAYKDKSWEEVMRYKEDNSSTVIYMQPTDNGKYEYSLYINEKGELRIISILGNITLEDIKSVTD